MQMLFLVIYGCICLITFGRQNDFACHIHFQFCYYINTITLLTVHAIVFSVIMFTVAVYSLLLQIVLSFHISIDGERGNDSRGCIQGQVSCQSLQYVAMMTNDTLRDNVTIAIIGSPLSLSGSVVFSGINGLNLTGNIKCNQSYSCNYNGLELFLKVVRMSFFIDLPWKIVDYTTKFVYGHSILLESKQFFSPILTR